MSKTPDGPQKGPITVNANSPWGTGGSDGGKGSGSKGSGGKGTGGKSPWDTGRPPARPDRSSSNKPTGGQSQELDNVIRGLKDKFGGGNGGSGIVIVRVAV